MGRSTNPRMRAMLQCAVITIAFAVRVGATAQDFQMTEQQFNSWLTNGSTSPEERAETQAKAELKAIERVCGLADAQRLKLELAAQGDVDRFESSISQLREEVVGKTFEQDEINDVYQRIQPYAQRCQQGLLGDDSLFQKCLLSTLDPQQYEKYDEAQFQKRCVTYDAKVRLYVGILERSLPMTHRQRTLLVDRLIANTFPPKRFGTQDFHYVMSQASKVPIDELEKEFDEAQLKVLRVALNQGRSYDQFLKQQGYEPDDRRATRDAQPPGGDANKNKTADAKEAT